MRVANSQEAVLHGKITATSNERPFIKWRKCGSLGILTTWTAENGTGHLVEVEVARMRRTDLVEGLRKLADAIEAL